MPILHANGDQTFSQEELETLLHMERAAEREACARVAETIFTRDITSVVAAETIALAIRNRATASN